jgi:hypothetical protein
MGAQSPGWHRGVTGKVFGTPRTGWDIFAMHWGGRERARTLGRVFLGGPRRYPNCTCCIYCIFARYFVDIGMSGGKETSMIPRGRRENEATP